MYLLSGIYVVSQSFCIVYLRETIVLFLPQITMFLHVFIVLQLKFSSPFPPLHFSVLPRHKEG